MKRILETERLLIREFIPADSSFIMQLLNSPGWLRYIGDRNVRSEDDAINYLTNGPMKSYREHGYGLWLVALKDQEAPIGMCGLIKRDYLEHTDIGFAFLPEYTGKGYAEESAQAVFNYAKSTLFLPIIAAITVPGNASSIKLLEKLEFKQQRTIELNGEQLLLFQTS
jgi:[ribosomal protein S5]-alanine N-acetyltransferase